MFHILQKRKKSDPPDCPLKDLSSLRQVQMKAGQEWQRFQARYSDWILGHSWKLEHKLGVTKCGLYWA